MCHERILGTYGQRCGGASTEIAEVGQTSAELVTSETRFGVCSGRRHTGPVWETPAL